MRNCIVYIISIISVFSQQLYAQPNPPNKWRVGHFGEIDFTSTIGVPFLSLDTIGTTFSNTGAWDSLGNFILHSNGFNVYDANLDILPGSPLIYDSTYLYFPSIFGSSIPYGAIILPMPGHSNQYNIFHTSYKGPDSTSSLFFGELYYSIIDLSQNNGLGVITTVKNVLIDDTTWTGYLSAVRHGNGRDWWLVSGRNYSNVINTWLVQSDTIMGPFSQPVGLSLTWPQALNQTQFSPDGNILAIAYSEFSGNVYKLILSDFNRCTGILSNINVLQINNNDPMNSGVTGVEFSSSGRYLYAGTGVFLYQFDLWASNIQNSMTLVKVHDQFPSPFQSAFSAAKRGPDHKIYMATGAGNYGIDIINHPDSLGIACDVQLRQIDYNTQFGGIFAMNILVMPNYPDYTLGALFGSPCDTITSVTDYDNLTESLSIYPNPSSGSFTLNYDLGNQKNVFFEMVDIYGREVYKTSLKENLNVHNISVPDNVANGVYVGRVVSEKGLVSGKMVLQR